MGLDLKILSWALIFILQLSLVSIKSQESQKSFRSSRRDPYDLMEK